jgi:hypothetical protein
MLWAVFWESRMKSRHTPHLCAGRHKLTHPACLVRNDSVQPPLRPDNEPSPLHLLAPFFFQWASITLQARDLNSLWTLTEQVRKGVHRAGYWCNYKKAWYVSSDLQDVENKPLPKPAWRFPLCTKKWGSQWASLLYVLNGADNVCYHSQHTSCLLGRLSTSWTTPPALFLCVFWLFFKIGSRELFAQAGFEPWSS